MVRRGRRETPDLASLKSKGTDWRIYLEGKITDQKPDAQVTAALEVEPPTASEVKIATLETMVQAA